MNLSAFKTLEWSLCRRLSFHLLAGLACLPSASPAEDVPAPAGDRDCFVIFQLDNDLFTGSDRDYTNGARVAWLRPVDGDKLNWAQDRLRDLSGTGEPDAFKVLSAKFKDTPVEFDFGIGLTQLMFTPSNPEWTSAPTGERPYAGWLGIEFSLHARNVDAVNSVVLSVGTTGEDAMAQETQNWVHRNISNSPIFQGWDSQIPGEVTVNLNFDRKWRYGFLTEAARGGWVEADGYLEWGVGIGNFRTDAYVGTLLRAGFNLPAQYATPRIQLGNYSHELFRSGDDPSSGNWSLYLFGGARGSGVAHDITLDGPLFRNFETGASSEPWVGEIVAGVGFRYRRLMLTYARTFRSKEIKEQRQAHQFGSILASVGF